MLRTEAEPGPDARPNNQWRGVGTAGQVAHLRRFGDKHVEGDTEELDEHDLHHRAQSCGSGTNGGAAETHL